MAIVFPVNPSVNDTFTVGSITYKWDSTKWIGLGVTPIDRLIEGSNSLEINANNNLVWTGNQVHLVDTAETTASLFVGSTKKSSWQAQDNFGNILYSYDGEPLIFSTSSSNSFSEKLRITSDGNVGINRTNPDQRLNVSGNIELNAYDSASGAGGYFTSKGLIIGNLYDAGKSYTGSDDRSACIWQERGLDLDFATNDSLKMKLTYDGRLLLGSTGRASVVTDPYFQIEGVAANNASMSIIRNSGANPPYLQLAATGGSTLGSLTATPSSGFLGQIVFGGSNGTELRPGVYITGQNDTNTAWTSTSCPTKIVIGTTKANQTSPTTAFSIDSNGIVRSHQTGISGSSLTLDLGSNQVVAGFQAKEMTGAAQALTGYWFNHGGLNAGIASTRQVTNQWGTDLRFYTHPFATNNQHKVYERLRIDPDGRIFIRDLLGNASSGSNVKYSNSDDELRYDTSSGLLKTNITECPYGIETVKKLKPSRYTPQEYDKEGNINVTDEVLIGFIAEEMVEEVPEVVQMYPKYTLTRNDEDTEIVPASISYDKLTAVLTKALQEAIVEIETLKGRLDAAGL